MKHDIKAKLAEHLAKGIESERDVVYLLVELRKLIELGNLREQFFALNFFACWAVHPFLKREGAKRIVERFDAYEQSGHKTTNTIWDTVQLNKFREQLAQFLKLNRLDPGIAEQHEKWTFFLGHFLHVVEDCPLKASDESLPLVNEVSVKVTQPFVDGDLERGVCFQWKWKVKGIEEPKVYEAWVGLSVVPAEPQEPTA
jgi:hypothetical protein